MCLLVLCDMHLLLLRLQVALVCPMPHLAIATALIANGLCSMTHRMTSRTPKTFAYAVAS
jgi:hypothetical protein